MLCRMRNTERRDAVFVVGLLDAAWHVLSAAAVAFCHTLQTVEQ